MFLDEVKNIRQARERLKKLGVTAAGIEIMAPKMIGRVIEFEDLDTRAANMLKQNILSLGGDLALPRSAYQLGARKTAAILMGDREQVEVLVDKLERQPFGLRKVGEELKRGLRDGFSVKRVAGFREGIIKRSILEKWPKVEVLKSRGKRLSLKEPVVMGILNVTPDSFSDGGQFYASSEAKRIDKAVRRAAQMMEEGARIIDIGGESTGPGSKAVSLDEEWKRVEGVIKAVKKLVDKENSVGLGRSVGCAKSVGLAKLTDQGVWLSIDTYKAEIARRALDLGVDMVNDVTGLRGDKKMVSVIAAAKVPVVLMYAKDPTPRTTLKEKCYKDVMFTVKEFLMERIDYAVAQGIKREQIVVDPGMGAFVSMDLQYSFEILRRLRELKRLDQPILVGASRKSFLGAMNLSRLAGCSVAAAAKPGLAVNERLEASLAAATIAVSNGAQIIRVHDVKETGKLVSGISYLVSSMG